jgi:nucleotide-binding universal stress UspA family protein
MKAEGAQFHTKLSTVMVATDFLESSLLALDYAAAFARHFHAELITLNVFEFGPHSQNVEILSHVPCRERRDAETRLQAFTSGVDKLGVRAKWVLEEGSVLSGILKGLSLFKVDLLVLGTRGVHRGLNHLFIGSNTEALMLNSPCPTLTIGPYVHGGTNLELGFNRILYVSDFSEGSTVAAPFVQSLARDWAADVEIFQVLPESVRNDSSRIHQLASSCCAALESFRPNIVEEWCIPEFQISRISTAEEVLAQARDTSALLVLGVQPATYLGRHLHTSLPYRLLAEAFCPVLTVPGNAE